MDLIQVIVARQQPDSNICLGSYLIDKLCLGVKNTLAKADIAERSYEAAIAHHFRAGTREVCSPELAHQMVYASIDYAAKYGFSPQKDFELSQYLLAPRGELNEPYKLTFGRNGKPFFVAGPYDNVKQILAQLDRTAGPGNYDYMVPPEGFVELL